MSNDDLGCVIEAASVERQVWLSLTDRPIKAVQIAYSANFGLCQAYQTLVRLHDRGAAFMVTGSANGHLRIEGWVR